MFTSSQNFLAHLKENLQTISTDTGLTPQAQGAIREAVSADGTPFSEIDAMDTALAVCNICDGLAPETRQIVRETWREVQDAYARLRPNSVYAQVIRDLREKEKAQEQVTSESDLAGPPSDDPGSTAPDETEPTAPLGTATYNITDDKLRFYPFTRLSDADYQEARRVGFVRWPRQQLFAAKWSTAAEDTLLHHFGVTEIEADDTPDDAEARAERYGAYSSHAGERAEAARQSVHRIADRIPLGQPILVGHHSERHARADVKRIDNGMHKAVVEWKKEAYWQDRAKSALAHADHKESAPAIYRRIKGLEAEERRYQREACRANWTAPYDYETQSYNTDPELWERHLARATRWLEHVQARLAYERALYEASGGIQADKLILEVGGAIKTRGQWRTILRVNKKTVTVEHCRDSGPSWTSKVDLDEIAESKTRDEWQATQHAD